MTSSAFCREFQEWLQLLDLDVSREVVRDVNFPVIVVKRKNQVILAVGLVELANWKRINEPASFLFRKTSDRFRAAGIPFVTLWEDVWYSKRAIVQSRISTILGFSNKLPGRVTQVRRILKDVALSFLHSNHLQDGAGAKFRLGLFLPPAYFRLAPFLNVANEAEVLVAVATFSHPRIFEKNGKQYRSYELVRFASLLNTTVVGGLAKLISAFERERNPDDIMTYADLDWSEGKGYLQTGFEVICDTEPHYFWLDQESGRRYPKQWLDDSAQNNHRNRYILVKNSGSRKYIKYS